MGGRDTVRFRGVLNPPAPIEVVEGLRAETGVALPDGYLAFLRKHDGGHGTLGETMLILWRAEELARLNRDYEVAEMIPELFLFGSNGGGLAYGFDTRPEAKMAVVQVEFVGLDWRYVRPVASSFGNMWWALASDGDEPEREVEPEPEEARTGHAAPPRRGLLARIFGRRGKAPGEAAGAIAGADSAKEPVELHMITPLIFGGDPEDSANLTLLTRAQHVEVVRFWNKAIRDMKRDGRWLAVDEEG